MQKCEIRYAGEIFAVANVIYFAYGKMFRGLRPALYNIIKTRQRFPKLLIVLC